LAKVLCSVVKFSDEETRKVMEREESRRDVCINVLLLGYKLLERTFSM